MCLVLAYEIHSQERYGRSISTGPGNIPRVQTSPSATEEINNLETKVEILKTSEAEN